MKNLLFLFVCTFLFTLSVKSQNLEWVTHGNCSLNTYNTDLVLHDDGFLYSVGVFSDTLNFYSPEGDVSASLYTTGNRASYLAKLTTDGDLIWAKSFGESNTLQFGQLLVDSDGEFFIMGSFSGTVDFDPGEGESTLTSDYISDYFTLKLNSQGEFIWVNQIEVPGYVRVIDAELIEAGNLLITGKFNSTGAIETIDMDPGEGVYNIETSSGYEDAFLLRLDNDGQFVFGRSWAQDDNMTFFGVEINSLGEIVLAASFTGTIDFDPGEGVEMVAAQGIQWANSLNRDVAIVKLDSQANFEWVKIIGSDGRELCGDVKVDNLDNIYLSGSFEDDSDFDPGESDYILTSLIEKDIYVAKYDTHGNLIWVETAQSTGDDAVYFDIASNIFLSKTGNVYVAGRVSGDYSLSVNADTVTNSVTGSFDLFLGKINPGGNWSWFNHFGSIEIDDPSRLLIDDEENIYLSGNYKAEFAIGDEDTSVVLPLAGERDLMMAKFSQCADTYVHKNGSSLTSNAEDATYQWIDCETDEPIEGADGQTFSPDHVGSYAVVVTQRGCTDTSICHEIDEVGFGGFGSSLILIYPNPASAELVVESEVDGYIQMYNSIGELLIEQNVYAGVNHINVSRFPVAHYIVRFFSDSGTESKKFVIER